jgi:hypothetical protein
MRRRQDGHYHVRRHPTAVLVAVSAALLGLLSLIAAAPDAHAQSWPQRTVRFIIPLPPGSGMDLSARVVAERLAQKWGQPVVVENRQGADAIPAVTAFFAARDNHTFMFSFGGIVTFNHLLHAKLPYDPAELVPLAPVIDNFLGVSATALLKVNTLAELVATAKKQPGKLNYAVTPGLPVYVPANILVTWDGRNRTAPSSPGRLITRLNVSTGIALTQNGSTSRSEGWATSNIGSSW